ncbi:hypothetical protein BLSTO_03218 [Blastocystis sp. subtype 1]
MEALRKLISVDFEVFGKVQGVWFRKYTQEQATKLTLVGWCMNTPHGTVQGVMQGSVDRINEMKEWLQHTGSPLSHIECATFTNERSVDKVEFDSFSIRR